MVSKTESVDATRKKDAGRKRSLAILNGEAKGDKVAAVRQIEAGIRQDTGRANDVLLLSKLLSSEDQVNLLEITLLDAQNVGSVDFAANVRQAALHGLRRVFVFWGQNGQLRESHAAKRQKSESDTKRGVKRDGKAETGSSGLDASSEAALMKFQEWAWARYLSFVADLLGFIKGPDVHLQVSSFRTVMEFVSMEGTVRGRDASCFGKETFFRVVKSLVLNNHFGPELSQIVTGEFAVPYADFRFYMLEVIERLVETRRRELLSKAEEVTKTDGHTKEGGSRKGKRKSKGTEKCEVSTKQFCLNVFTLLIAVSGKCLLDTSEVLIKDRASEREGSSTAAEGAKTFKTTFDFDSDGTDGEEEVGEGEEEEESEKRGRTEGKGARSFLNDEREGRSGGLLANPLKKSTEDWREPSSRAGAGVKPWPAHVAGGKKKGEELDLSMEKGQKKRFSDCWVAFLRLPLPRDVYLKVLLRLPTRVIPYMVNPLVLADFLTDSYNIGGAPSLLALSSLFHLMQHYNLDYPDFYGKLYRLLDTQLLHAPHRAKFFHLLALFLSSSHLPSYLLAAFMKKLGRLSLGGPPAAALFVIPLCFNLILKHKELRTLIHRERPTSSSIETSCGEGKETEGQLASAKAVAREQKAAKDGDNDRKQRKSARGGQEKGRNDLKNVSSSLALPGSDPFIMDEQEPGRSRALESSLWEVYALRHHYNSAVATMAQIFEDNIDTAQACDLDEFCDFTYHALFQQQLRRREKGETPVNYRKCSGFFSCAADGLQEALKEGRSSAPQIQVGMVDAIFKF